jgi:general secretion pathway protein I
MTGSQARGFTLLEVMVALAIVSIGLIAAFNGIIQMAHSSATLRDRALADWIAMNQITEIRLSGEFPEIGRFDGNATFADREWRWEARIAETGVRDLRRIDLYVARAEFPDDPVTIMAGFVSRGAPGGVRIDWWGPTGSAGGGEDPPPEEAEEVQETPPPPRGPRQPRRPPDAEDE